MDIKLIFSSSAVEKLCHNTQVVGDVGKTSWMGSSLHPLTGILCRPLPCPLLSHLKSSLSSCTGMLRTDSDTKSLAIFWLLLSTLVLDGQDYHIETWLMWWASEKDLFCYHTGLPFSFLIVTTLARNSLGSADNSTLSKYSGIKIYTRPFTVFFMSVYE